MKKLLKSIPGLQQLHRLYLSTCDTLSWKLFENHRPLKTNAVYWLHHQYAKIFFQQSNKLSEAEQQYVKELRQKHFTRILPTSEVATLAASARAKMDALFVDGTYQGSGISGDQQFVFIDDAVTALPEIPSFITPMVQNVLENFYKSHFQIYRIRAYRTLPKEVPYEELRKSWRWHSDDYPNPVYKIMVYLTNSDQHSGAFRAHPYEKSKQIYKAGFFDRYEGEQFLSLLEDSKSYEWIGGPAGTVAIFDNNLVHRATPPSPSQHRDVIVIELIPSLEPWNIGFKRLGTNLSSKIRDKFKYPTNPFKSV